jgi:hypothetical protein
MFAECDRVLAPSDLLQIEEVPAIVAAGHHDLALAGLR